MTTAGNGPLPGGRRRSARPRWLSFATGLTTCSGELSGDTSGRVPGSIANNWLVARRTEQVSTTPANAAVTMVVALMPVAFRSGERKHVHLVRRARLDLGGREVDAAG